MLNPRCDMFFASYSNEGFAYTFNSAGFWDVHRDDHQYNKLFSEIMGPKKASGFVYPKSTGSSHGLEVRGQLSKLKKSPKQGLSHI